MSDSQQNPAVTAVLERYWGLCEAYENIQESIGLLQARQRALLAEINDCFAAGRLFGLDLAKPPTSRGAAAGQSIKGLVLQAAQDAYPEPVQAPEVRQLLARLGHSIHEKTVGMTLYRWSLAGRVRRVGRDWYFVPQDARPTSDNHRPAPERERVLEMA